MLHTLCTHCAVCTREYSFSTTQPIYMCCIEITPTACVSSSSPPPLPPSLQACLFNAWLDYFLLVMHCNWHSHENLSLRNGAVGSNGKRLTDVASCIGMRLHTNMCIAILYTIMYTRVVWLNDSSAYGKFIFCLSYFIHLLNKHIKCPYRHSHLWWLWWLMPTGIFVWAPTVKLKLNPLRFDCISLIWLYIIFFFSLFGFGKIQTFCNQKYQQIEFNFAGLSLYSLACKVYWFIHIHTLFICVSHHVTYMYIYW